MCTVLLYCVLFVCKCALYCCTVYCLCVNVYCTAATGCQPNCSQQIYHITLAFTVRYLSYRGRDFIVAANNTLGSTSIYPRAFATHKKVPLIFNSFPKLRSVTPTLYSTSNPFGSENTFATPHKKSLTLETPN